MCAHKQKCAPKKGKKSAVKQAALTTPINVNKKVPVMLKQSRAKRPLLRNTIHAQVHVCLAGVYTTHLSGNTVGCFQFHCKFNMFGLFALVKATKLHTLHCVLCIICS